MHPPICYGVPVTGSISASGQKLDHNYQSVVEQSGLFAGDGGFDIKVGGHTQLNGAAIVSNATSDKNKLITQTLDYADITNIEKTKVSGYSFGLGTTVASNYYAPTPGVNDNRTSVTQALVSPGTIEIKGQQAQFNKLVGQYIPVIVNFYDLQGQLAALNEQLPALQNAAAQTQAVLGGYNPIYSGKWTGWVFVGNNACWDACLAGYHAAVQANAVKQAELSALQTQINQKQAEVTAVEATQTAKLAEIVKLNGQVSTLQSRTLATANPALKNTFNASRTRAQLEAMNVFSETAMRIVGDVYKTYETAVTKADDNLLKAKISGDQVAIDKAAAELKTAKEVWASKQNERVLAHGLVGGLTAALGGADPVSGAIGASASKFVTTELDKLLADNQWAKDNPYAANLLKTLSATAAGSIVGGSTGGFVASQGDRFNRQLHPSEYSLAKRLRSLAAQFFSKRGGKVVTEEEAEGRIVRQMQRSVDYQIAQTDDFRVDELVIAFMGSYLPKKDEHYYDPTYNSQYNSAYSLSLNKAKIQALSGLTPSQLRDRNRTSFTIASLSSGLGFLDSLKTLTTGSNLYGDEESRWIGLLGVVTGGVGQKIYALGKADGVAGFISVNGQKIDKTWQDAEGNLLWRNPLTNVTEAIPAGAKVHVDHVLPKQYVKDNVLGFNELPANVQNALLNDPKNLQPMLASANCSKGCKVEFDVNGGWKTWNGEPVNGAYKEYLESVQSRALSTISEAVARFR